MRYVRLVFCCACCLFSCQKPHQEVVKTSYFHQYGPEVSSQEWKDQGATGEIVQLKSDGVEVRKSYVNGELHGPSTWTYPHSKVVERFEEYSSGRKVSSGHNFPSGSPDEEKEWLVNQDVLHRFWYEDGSPRAIEQIREDELNEGQYYNDEGDLESVIAHGTGVRIIRSPQGVLLSREQLIRGEMVTKELFHSNGVVQEVCSYRQGKKEGLRKCFDSTGRPERIETYKNDQLDGPTTHFRDGIKISRISYKEGKKDGSEQHFGSDPSLVIEEISWLQDERHGPSTLYIESGPLTEWYWRGASLTEEQFRKNEETVKASQK